jgi:YD repeat-containing protein
MMAFDLPSASIQCSVEVEREAGAVRLRGRVVSLHDAQGDYRLQIIKSGRSGSSRIAQGGRFEAKARVPAYVGSATLDFGATTRVSARLTIASGDKTYSCETHEEGRP